MVEKSIIWSEKAIYELRQILEFYTKRNGNSDYSFKILDEIEASLETLKLNEFIGRLTNNKKTRVIVMDVYLIFYEVQKERIEVVSFWDNRQEPEKEGIINVDGIQSSNGYSNLIPLFCSFWLIP
jgi:toxin YoeB